MTRPLAGIFPYLVSPVEAGGVREDVLRRLVAHLIDSGVHGLTPLGSTGEVPYLSLQQQLRLVAVVVDEARQRVPVVAGVSGTSTAEAVHKAQAFEAMGVDAVVAILNTYFPLPERDLIGYFTSVARAVKCPVVLYSNPRLAGFDLSLPVLDALLESPNIGYFKDASGDTGKLLTVANRFGDRLRLFSASAHIPLFVLMLGGVGWMAGPACLIPRQSVQLFHLAQARKWDEALALQRRLWSLNAAFQKYSLAACIKAGLELQGFDVGAPVPPQGELGSEARAEIAAVLREIGAL